jgi:acetolactate synthase-1/2/3 large subunit
MTGADSLLRMAAALGVRVCFANPGTTELPLVGALGRTPEIRPILALFEGVCTGAADGYARMTGVPALTLLHLGPGLANGLANLHNARRAGTPVVNLIGDHATWHRAADAALTTDIAAVAGPFSDWVREYQSARDMAAAIEVATSRQVATLIVPYDVQRATVAGYHEYAVKGGPASHGLVGVGGWRPFDPAAVPIAAAAIRKDRSTALLLGGPALTERGLRAAGRVAAHGCHLLCQPRPPRMERGGDLPAPERLPYFPDHVLAVLKRFRTIILAGAREPVSFFGYDGFPSRLIDPSQEVVTLAKRTDDAATALEALADELGAPPHVDVTLPPRPMSPTGPLTAESIAAAIVAVQPEGAIIVDEGLTTTPGYFPVATAAPPHTYMTITGGSIGFGMPCVTGAAIACPDRKVINLQADGSGLYTPQSLWTQARESLNIVTVIFANRRYRILEIEAARDGGDFSSAARLFSLGDPAPDWVQLAGGFGVPSVRVESADDLVRELSRAVTESGPRLIEVIM